MIRGGIAGRVTTIIVVEKAAKAMDWGFACSGWSILAQPIY